MFSSHTAPITWTPQHDKDFEEMLNSMNLPAEHRAKMQHMPTMQKLPLLLAHKEKEKAATQEDKGGKVKNSPQVQCGCSDFL
jgi:hypothetical protein